MASTSSIKESSSAICIFKNSRMIYVVKTIFVRLHNESIKFEKA